MKVSKATRTSVDTSFPTPFYKKASVKDTYNQLTLKCRNGYSIQFRAYDDGAAYRFVSELRRPFCVKNEIAEFNFDRDYHAFVPYINDNRAGERYCYSFESYYDEVPLSRMYKDSLAITPLLVELENGKKAVIMEAGLSNYPGMFLTANPQTPHGIKAEFAPYPLETIIGGYDHLNLVPTKRADIISKPNDALLLPQWASYGETGLSLACCACCHPRHATRRQRYDATPCSGMSHCRHFLD